MDELVAEDYLDHSPPPFPGLSPGRAGLKQDFRLFWDATPGTHHIDEGTGNEFTMTVIAIHRVADGRLAEKWSEKDVPGMLQQPEVIPRPPAHAQ